MFQTSAPNFAGDKSILRPVAQTPLVGNQTGWSEPYLDQDDAGINSSI